MSYFKHFKRTQYDIEGNGNIQALVNLTSSVKISDALINNVSFYNYVAVHDGERMEQLSHRLYGSTNYYWTFLLVNKNIKNIWNDWPKSNNQVAEYCDKKYQGACAIVTDGSLDSSKFSSGDIIRIDDMLDPSYIPRENRAEINKVYTNNGYVSLIPISFCTEEFDSDGAPIGDKTTCELNDGKWKTPDLISKVAGNGSYRQINIINERCINTLGEITDLDEGTCTQTTGYNWEKIVVTADKITNGKNAPHHYVDNTNGNIVPVAADGVTPVSFEEFEIYLNNVNRNVVVIKPEYIREIAKEFEKEIGK